MSTPTEAAEPTTPEVATLEVEAEPELEPGTVHDDPFFDGYLEDLIEIDPSIVPAKTPEPEVEPEPEAEPEAEAKAEPEAEAKAEPEAEAKESKYAAPELDRNAIREAVNDIVAEQQIAAPPSEEPEPVAAPQTEADAYEASLLAEQRDELEMARYAGTKYTEHQGADQRLLEYYKEVDAFAKDKGEDFDPDGFDFKELLKKKPNFGGQHRRIEREYIEDNTARRVLGEQEQRFEKQERKLVELEMRPKIDKAVDSFAQAIFKDMEGDSAEAWRDGKSKDSFPLENTIYKEKESLGRSLAGEYLKVVNGITPFNYENQTHNYLNEFVDQQGRYFEQYGAEGLVRDGLKFLPRIQFKAAMEKDAGGAQAQYWTFSHEDVLQMLAFTIRRDTEGAVKGELERLSRYGFERKLVEPSENSAPTPNPEPSQAAEPQPVNPPKATPTASIGAGTSTEPTENHPGTDILATLGIE